jgi:hypothetical protein
MKVSPKTFQLMLWAYPRDFRREYGFHMTQVFRDCHRSEIRSKGSLGLARLWLHTVFDVARSAPRERWDNFRKDNSIMSKPGKDIAALLICLAIVVGAFFLLSYGKKNEVSVILTFGRVLDALVTTGIVANIIIFLMMLTSRFNPLRIALWTLLLVHGVLLLAAVIIGSRVDPTFKIGGVLIAYVVSFMFWFALHWIWSTAKKQVAVSSEP